jgi:hypothetical protein
LTLTEDQLVRITKEGVDPGVFATMSAQDWINEFCSEAAIVNRVYVHEEFFRLFAVAVGFDYVQILTRGAASTNCMNLHTVSCSSWDHDYVTDDEGVYSQRVIGSVLRIAHVDGNHYALVWKGTELEDIRALVQSSIAYPKLLQLELADIAARSVMPVASSVSVLPSDPQASPGITLMAQQSAKATKASPSSARRSRSRSIGPVTSAKPAASVHATPSAQQTPSTPASAGAAQIPQGPVAYGVNQRPAKSAPKKASSKKRPVREKTEKGKKGPRAKTVDISIDPPDAPSHIPLVPITEREANRVTLRAFLPNENLEYSVGTYSQMLRLQVNNWFEYKLTEWTPEMLHKYLKEAGLHWLSQHVLDNQVSGDLFLGTKDAVYRDLPQVLSPRDMHNMAAFYVAWSESLLFSGKHPGREGAWDPQRDLPAGAQHTSTRIPSMCFPIEITADNVDFKAEKDVDRKSLRHYAGMVAAQERVYTDHLDNRMPVGDTSKVKLAQINPDGYTAEVFRCDAMCAV